MLKIRCLLCLERELNEFDAIVEKTNPITEQELEDWAKKRERLITEIKFNIFSFTLSKNDAEAVTLLGGEMIRHIGRYHEEEIKKIQALNGLINGFNVMKLFEGESSDGIFEQNKEQAREQIMEEILRFAPDVDEDDEEEDDELTDDELDDDCEGGDEEFEDEDEEDELVGKAEETK